MADLKNDIRHFIEENFVFGAGPAFGDRDSFIDRHILDSTGFLELIAHLEATYDIKVQDHEMVPENLDSLDNVAAFVGRKRGAAAVLSRR
jgi:acyl carrier protein